MTESQIGVVVPTLNGAATLDWTLCSLRSQLGIRVDVLVADSGSKDGTLEICERWGVPTIYVPPGNMYRAINAGLRNLRTEWLAYLNSDDIVYPTSYARLVSLGEAEKVGLVYGDCDFLDPEGRLNFTQRSALTPSLKGMLLRGVMGFAQPAAVFRKREYDEAGGLDERFRHIADLDFFSRLVFSGVQVARLRGPTVAAFRMHPSQLSTREVGVVRAEEESLRRERHPVSRLSGLLDLYLWRARNWPTYAWRLKGFGRLRSTP